MVSLSRPGSRPASRPVTPGRSPPPPENETPQLPPIPESHPPRRSSLGGFLRRSKSSELGGQKSTGAKLSRKRSAREKEELLRRQREAGSLSASPPRLPDIYNGAPPSSLQTFGGDGARPDSYAVGSNRATRPPRVSIDTYSSNAPNNIPIPPIPEDAPRSRGGSYADPYARTESMTHRGRYSYASSAISTINSPRKVRRRKDPTPFNILVIGAKNSGKTSFLNFLRQSLSLPKRRGHIRVDDENALPQMSSTQAGNSAFESQYLETEIDGERIGLTLWDSQGLEKGMVDLQLREMSSFLESKFEDTFNEEMKVIRAPGVQDTHIHCVFLLLDPVRLEANVQAAKTGSSRTANKMNGAQQQQQQQQQASRIVGGLDEDLDLQVLRALQGKTTVVPIISKADVITSAHMKHLKRTVWDSLKKANLDPLEALGLDDLDGGDDGASDDNIPEGDEAAADEAAAEEAANNSSDSSMLIKQSNTSEAPIAAKPSSSSSASNKPPAATGTDTDSPRPARRLSQQLSPDETPYLPLSIISPDIYDPGTIGRKFPWGFADPYDAEHCDFVRLKEAVFSEWRGELREASRELWYEGWRTSRLKHRKSYRK